MPRVSPIWYASNLLPLVPKSTVMTNRQRAPRSVRDTSEQVGTTTRPGSGTNTLSGPSRAKPVTPISERIIKETTVKRRTAMRILANR